MPLPFLLIAWGPAAAAGGGAAAGGTGVKRIKDAKDSVEDSTQRLADAEEETTSARVACEAAFAALGEAKIQAVEGALLPFHDAFRRLKHVDLEVEVSREGAPPLDAVSVQEAGRLTVNLASVLGIGALGTGVGALASAGTTAAVGGLAAAGTGTAISGLSGVAATNATLAWLGGGTLAAGGGGVAAGTALLTGVAVAPAILVGGVFLHHKGGEAKAKAQQLRRGRQGCAVRSIAKHRRCYAAAPCTLTT